MLTLFSKLPAADRLVLKKGVGYTDCNARLKDMGLVHQVTSGFLMLHPIVQMVQAGIEACCLKNADAQGFIPVGLPNVMPGDLLRQSGKYDLFQKEFYHIGLGSHVKDWLINPTTEEFILNYLEVCGPRSYRNLPMRFAHPHEVTRHIERPEGLFKSRSFRSVLFSTIDRNPSSNRESLDAFCKVSENSFKALDIEVFRILSRDVGGVEYLFPCAIGDRPMEKSVVLKRTDQAEIADARSDTTMPMASIAMGYVFTESGAFNVSYNNEANKPEKPVMGTYGIGLQRCTYALFEKAYAGSPTAFPTSVRPFDVVVIPVGSQGSDRDSTYRELSDALIKSGCKVGIDDRSLSMGQKVEFSEFLSVPARIVVGGKMLASGRVEIQGEPGGGVSVAANASEIIVSVRAQIERRDGSPHLGLGG